MRKLIVLLALLLVFCFVFTASTVFAGAKEKAAEEEAAEGVSGQLEIFSWWTAGGEAEGLNAIIEIYEERYPDVELINAAVAGGAGANAKPILATRMIGGDPPESFQAQIGKFLIDTWGVSDLLEPLNFLFEEEGWYDDYSEAMVKNLSMEGDILAVPVNIHRTNVLWYNPKVFEDIGAKPPTTFDEFFAVSEKLQNAGIIPFCLGDSVITEATTAFETVLLGVLGPDDYMGLFDGSTRWDSAETKEAIATWVRMLDYVNDDHSALTDVQAAQYVADGIGAMTISGDWQHGYFLSVGLTPNVDYKFMATPGSAGIFNGQSDAFVLPKNVKNREAAVEWLRVCGSREAQDAFNPQKGSIPARLGPDTSLYDAYLQWSIESYASNRFTPSLSGGIPISEAWLSDINDVMTVLNTEKNVENAAKAFQAAADNNM
jgi:glucose/mannose transport system substrate-binding protein